MALLLTIIGRIVDGLPLAASMPSDEQVSSLTSFSFFFKGVRLGSLVKLHCFQLTFSRLESKERIAVRDFCKKSDT